MRRTLLWSIAILAGTVSSASGQPARRLTLPPVGATPIVYLPTPTPAPPLPSVELPPELDRVLRDYERAWAARNAEALSRLFAEDGFVMSEGKPPVRGRDAIRAAYAGSGGPLVLRALGWATDGASGYIVGGFGREAGRPDTGKFVLALKRGSDGRWLIAADMDNSNRRPQSQPTPPPVAATAPGGAVPLSGDVAKAREVWRAFDTWLTAYSKGDLEGVMAIFDEGVRFSYQGVKDQGYADLKASYVRDFQDRKPGTSWVPAVEEIYADGRLAIVRAIWKLEVKGADGKTETKGRNRSIDVLRFGDDGRWRILRSTNYPEKG
ncbi:MAG TPA: nuclear transport factor 2 family protein [Thermoanaerobaculia bacterium]